MRVRILAIIVAFMATAAAASIAIAREPRQAQAQSTQTSGATLNYYAVQDIVRSSRSLSNCTDPSMLIVEGPQQGGRATQGVIVLCERR